MKTWLYACLLLVLFIMAGCGKPQFEISVHTPPTFTEGNPTPLQINLKDSNGQPLSGALVEAELHMKEMDHGAIQASTEEIETGKYLALPKLSMDGTWVATIHVTYNGSTYTFTQEFTSKLKTTATAHAVTSKLHYPAFQLTDQENHPVTEKDLAGKTVIMTFAYLNCTDANACPVLLGNLKKLQSAYEQKGISTKDLLLVAISVDPENDTPARLKQHADEMKFDTSYLKMLTGSIDQVQHVADALKFQFKQASNEVAHENKTFVFAPDGTLTHEFTNSAVDIDELVEITTK